MYNTLEMPKLPIPNGRPTITAASNPRRSDPDRPTAKQLAFVEEYLVDHNKLAAYLRAGYSSKNARVEAYKLFNRPAVQKALAARQAERARKNEVTIHSVISSLHRIAESAEDQGKYAAAIRAFELLGKHLGMFVDKTELTHKHEIAADPKAVEAEIARLVSVAFGDDANPPTEADDETAPNS